MSKIKSIFGPYADQLQVMIDRSQERFAPTWYQRYFGWAPPQASLTYVSVIGRSRIEAAASIVARDSATPQRSRAGLEKLTGEIPAIKEMIKMTESDYRDFMTLQQLNVVDDQTKKRQLLDFMFNDVKIVGDSAFKRLDIMVLQGVSTGKISVTVDNNPDGLVLTESIDLFMPDDNKRNASINWATSASAKPLDDIEAVVEAASAKGYSFEKMLMSRALWIKFKACTSVINALSGFYNISKSSATVSATLDKVNEYLQANQLPVIELVDENIGVEKDGKISTIKPFDQDNVSFIPKGNLGVIRNAIAIESMKPVSTVSYANLNRALISKWSENEPFGEWTKVELNAFPAFEAIDGMYILDSVPA